MHINKESLEDKLYQIIDQFNEIKVTSMSYIYKFPNDDIIRQNI